jgi:protein transport protein SEC24
MPSYHMSLPHPSANRQPEPMRYVFVIDVSSEAVKSGLVHSACAALLDILYGPTEQTEQGDNLDTGGPCFPSGSQIAVITFDRTLHFYNLSVRESEKDTPCGVLTPRQPTSEQASMLVVADIDEVFVPLRGELFGYPNESR